MNDFNSRSGVGHIAGYVDPYIKIAPESLRIINELKEFLKIVPKTRDFLPLYNAIKNSITRIDLYTEWQEGEYKKNGTNTKFFFNRKTKQMQDTNPAIDHKNQKSLGVNRGELNFMPRIAEVDKAQDVQTNTSSEVQFLLGMAEVNDAEEVLHAMRLMLA